jgi:HEAT repeat protein
VSREPDLRGESAAARIRAMDELAERSTPPSEEETEALLACLADRRKPVQRRAAECFAALIGRGLPLEGLLHGALAGAEWRLRWGATFALSLAGEVPVGALETLVEALGVADGDLRWAAVELLVRCAGIDRGVALPRLLGAASSGSDVQRKMALYCLRDAGARHPAVLAAAEQALAETNTDLRLAGLSALARLHGDRSAASLRVARLLVDGDERIRRAAAGTLGRMGAGSPEVLAALRRALDSEDSSLRRAAATALRTLTSEGT